VNYFTLPYTTANVISQKFASRTVNVNPFSYHSRNGTLFLSPNVDNWVDTSYAPALLIVDPNLQVWSADPSVTNVMSVGDWKAIPGTSVTNRQAGGNWVATQSYQDYSQNNILGNYSQISNTYALNNGYITDISVLPFIRQQQIVVRATDMLVNTPVNAYFDNTNIDNYVRKGNIIELTGVSGTFQQDDVIGFFASGTFTATGRVLGVLKKTATTTRLYVAADGNTGAYTTNGVIQNGFFDSNGTYKSSTATGVLSSTSHFGGQITSE
jgi:ribosomal protein S18 acetylase RimI-like enzyme